MVRNRKRAFSKIDIYEDPFVPGPTETPPDTPSRQRVLNNVLQDRSANPQQLSSREVDRLQIITGFLSFYNWNTPRGG
jgi:hypothetical protein